MLIVSKCSAIQLCSWNHVSHSTVNITTFPLCLTAAGAGPPGCNRHKAPAHRLPCKTVCVDWSASTEPPWQHLAVQDWAHLNSFIIKLSAYYSQKWGAFCSDPKPSVPLAAALRHLVPTALHAALQQLSSRLCLTHIVHTGRHSKWP